MADQLKRWLHLLNLCVCQLWGNGPIPPPPNYCKSVLLYTKSKLELSSTGLHVIFWDPSPLPPLRFSGNKKFLTFLKYKFTGEENNISWQFGKRVCNLLNDYKTLAYIFLTPFRQKRNIETVEQISYNLSCLWLLHTIDLALVTCHSFPAPQLIFCLILSLNELISATNLMIIIHVGTKCLTIQLT